MTPSNTLCTMLFGGMSRNEEVVRKYKLNRDAPCFSMQICSLVAGVYLSKSETFLGGEHSRFSLRGGRPSPEIGDCHNKKYSPT
jgi:hypothetical protein